MSLRQAMVTANTEIADVMMLTGMSLVLTCARMRHLGHRPHGAHASRDAPQNRDAARMQEMTGASMVGSLNHDPETWE
jgi:hypothetical protein